MGILKNTFNFEQRWESLNNGVALETTIKKGMVP